MKINIIGENGAFGSFLKELLAPHFELCSPQEAESIILAVPSDQYSHVAFNFEDKHLINVCSVQSKTTKDLLEITKNVTGIHPLFGRRTPNDKRNSIVTYECQSDLEQQFLSKFNRISTLWFQDLNKELFTPESHDILMAATHKKAVQAAQLIKPFITKTEHIPDELIPNSFRLMRDFVKTMEDMPAGTLSSILANPYE